MSRLLDTGLQIDDRSDARITEHEFARLQRGLLPVPLIWNAPVAVTARYRPGRAMAQLGGDFYDVVETADGRVWALLGDVSGHGPDEAALGVVLRAGWRAVVLAGIQPAGVLPAIQRLLVHERQHDEVFATACMIVIEPAACWATVYLAGHPVPLVSRNGDLYAELDVESGIALGVVDEAHWVGVRVALGDKWSLLCFTDGLVEGFDGPPSRLGEDGLINLMATHGAVLRSCDVDELLDRVIRDVTSRNGGPLADDLAMVHIRRTDTHARHFGGCLLSSGLANAISSLARSQAVA